MSIKHAYREKLVQLGLSKDPHQERIVDALQQLQDRIMADAVPYRRVLRALRLGGAPGNGRGMYLWGGVGRGKTFLMDLFFKTLGIERKRRIHFHRMMSEVHARLKKLGDVEDPLDKVAADIASETDVLCFDEFFVADIGDAMILGRLMHGLFRRGVVVVATSNFAPKDLYSGGLQRERFLPAIEILEDKTEVLHIGGTTDYRLRLLQKAGAYICPADEDANARLDGYFSEIASGDVQEDTEIEVNGRGIPAKKSAKGIAWFVFSAICDGPRSRDDYIEIARWYPTVIISGVPAFSAARDDAARRFISLVDEFYDRRVKLIVSAEVPIPSLYRGKRLRAEFARTASRLTEMQTTKYLHSQHLS